MSSRHEGSGALPYRQSRATPDQVRGRPLAGSAVAPSERVRVKRLHERGHYDAETIHPILDAMPICSVGYVFNGSPYVTPTLQWRESAPIYLHGPPPPRMPATGPEDEVRVPLPIIACFVLEPSG